MRLLEQYQSEVAAEQDAERLAFNGIPCHISGQYAHRLGGRFTGTFKVGLWVLVDEQYDEAQKLLRDPMYRVRYPLTKDEQRYLQTEARSRAFWSIIKFAGPIVVILTAAFIYFLHDATLHQ